MALAYDRGFSSEMGFGAKLLRFNWVLAALLAAAASVGFIMLYSVAGGSLDPWARLQIVRFAVGFGLMLLVALIDIRVWRAAAGPLYLISVGLLVVVEFFGQTGMGAQRWLALGPVLLQPSEIMKVSLVLALARYYDEIGPEQASSPIWIAPPLILALIPTLLVIKQPDLGTALLLMAGALSVMFLAGVSWWFFSLGAALAGGGVAAVFLSRGTEWQVLKNYQYDRIATFLNPADDPLGAGYHINQS